MTAAELQRVAARLSNSTWCRHWLFWRTAAGRPLMAVQAVDRAGGEWKVADLDGPDLERLGFSREWCDGIGWVWVVPRTNDDGTPYVAAI